MAKIYPSEPKPKIPPVATSLIRDFRLNSSLLYMFEICNSNTGFLKTSSASLIATEVCVKPAALMIIPSKFFLLLVFLLQYHPQY